MARARRREGRQEKSLQSRDLPWWFELYHLSWILGPIVIFYFLGIWPTLTLLISVAVISIWFG